MPITTAVSPTPTRTKYDDAVRDFDAAIKLNPKNAEAFYNRGLANGKLGKYDAAIDDYGEAIRLNPKDAEAPFNRGLAYMRVDKNDFAARDFTEVIGLQPKHTDAYVYRGLIRIYQGSRERRRRRLPNSLSVESGAQEKIGTGDRRGQSQGEENREVNQANSPGGNQSRPAD